MADFRLLLPYVRHENGCAATFDEEDGRDFCDCGLHAILTALSAEAGDAA